jgi:inorganic triphosphatase YgiF
VTDTGKYLETEQKYDADAGFVLPDFSGLKGRAKAAGRRRFFLSATYFDTEDLDLIKNRITLRRRVGGADEGWHLKLPVRKDTRQEVRTPLAAGEVGSVPATLAAQVEDVTAGRRLHPVAILDTERTVVTLSSPSGDPLAEVADDLVTGTRLDEPDAEPVRWREIEIEALADRAEVPGLMEAAGQALYEAGARRSSSASKLGRLLGTGPGPAQRLFIADSYLPLALFAWDENPGRLGIVQSRLSRGHTRQRMIMMSELGDDGEQRRAG